MQSHYLCIKPAPAPLTSPSSTDQLACHAMGPALTKWQREGREGVMHVEMGSCSSQPSCQHESVVGSNILLPILSQDRRQAS